MLTIVYITNRHHPQIQWTLEALSREKLNIILKEVIFVVASHSEIPYYKTYPFNVRFVAPKPTVWSGPKRLTKQDWWSASNARNTGLCLCQTPYVSFMDDRSLPVPGYLGYAKSAMDGQYVVCGGYEKVKNLEVQTNGTKMSYRFERLQDNRGVDSRLDYVRKYWDPKQIPFTAPGEWTFGCSITLATEWAMDVNGFDENCDGTGHEDCFLGLMLKNLGYPIRYDPRMMLLEDRTEGQCGPVTVRRDKGVSPNDKSHALVDWLKVLKRASHPIDLRVVSDVYHRTGVWPEPWGPTHDFFDGQPISEMTPG